MLLRSACRSTQAGLRCLRTQPRLNLLQPVRSSSSRASGAPTARTRMGAKEQPEKASKIKLLCLHGYTQNKDIFSQRIGSMRKALKSRCEFVFVDAPFESTGLPGDEVNEAQGTDTGGKSWWNWHDVGPTARPSLAAEYTGWEQALDVLVEAIKEHKPDGVLGFSQGATATALLLASLNQEEVAARLGSTPAPAFGILAAGFLPRDPRYADIVRIGKPSVPSLFISGKSDRLVPWERTKALMDCFDPSSHISVYEHEGAHLVPTCSGVFKQAMVEFLEKAMAERGQHQLRQQHKAEEPGSLAATASVAAAAAVEEVREQLAEAVVA